MNAAVKVGSYGAGVAVVVAAAFGLGNLTGSPAGGTTESPADRPAEHAAAGDSVGEAPGGLQVSQYGYTLSPINIPESAGTAGTLSFQILGPDGEPVTDYLESHEKELHLIIVRADTAEYRHVHPDLAADGTWSMAWEWAAGGTYKAFVDFTPAALGEGLTLTRTVDVAGAFAPAPPPPAGEEVAEVDGYTVTVSADLVAGTSSALTATVERDGQPVTDLEPYLGAYGHLVALRDGDLAYLHVHPEGEPGDGASQPGPEVSFVVETPTAGSYWLFFEFQTGGQVHTAQFTLAATGAGDHEPGGPEPGDPEPGGADDDEHGH